LARGCRSKAPPAPFCVAMQLSWAVAHWLPSGLNSFPLALACYTLAVSATGSAADAFVYDLRYAKPWPLGYSAVLSEHGVASPDDLASAERVVLRACGAHIPVPHPEFREVATASTQTSSKAVTVRAVLSFRCRDTCTLSIPAFSEFVRANPTEIIPLHIWECIRTATAAGVRFRSPYVSAA